MKKTNVLALTLLMSLLASAAVVASVNAQGNATIVILDSVGGTATASSTSPADGTIITLTATPSDPTYSFAYWLISGTNTYATTANDNPLSFTVTGGVTYTIQAVFQLVQPINNLPPANYSGAAIIVVLASAGGTTEPKPGTYALSNASTTELRAIPSSGYQFSNWVISGSDVTTGHGSFPTDLTPTNNPYTVDHGYGNVYYYQAVFKPTSTSSPAPSPTIPEVSGAAAIGIIAALGIVAVGTYAYKRKR